MEITDSSYAVFRACRLFGYGPYRVQRNKAGRIVRIWRSKVLCVYSVGVIGTLVIACIYGLASDAISPKPLRMKSTTSKLCTILDVNVVAGSCLLGILGAVLAERHVLDMNQRLHMVDKNLSHFLGDVKRMDRRVWRQTVFASYFMIMVLLLGMDVYGWYQVARKLERTHVGVAFVPKLFNYFPFYMLYIMMAVLQIQYAQAAVGLGNRFRWLNVALQNTSTRDKHQFAAAGSHSIQTVSGYYFHSRSLRQRSALRENENINRIAFVHELLGKSMRSMTSAFGLTVLLLLASCLLHLVVTAYFFVLEMLGDRNLFFSWLQCLWLAFHSLRLLMIVEPCHFTSVESSRTLKIVCKMMRSRRSVPESIALRSFWQQLLASESDFSACGICRIDRQLLTAFTGSIATYLVILLQFELSDSDGILGGGSSATITTTVSPRHTTLATRTTAATTTLAQQ